VSSPLYARHEAASALAVSLRKIDYLVSDQKLRTRRIGRRVVIPAEDVKRLVDEIMRSDLL
jgi:excisionase family DNA binding protein